MKTKYISLIIAALALLSSCTKEPDEVEVDGYGDVPTRVKKKLRRSTSKSGHIYSIGNSRGYTVDLPHPQGSADVTVLDQYGDTILAFMADTSCPIVWSMNYPVERCTVTISTDSTEYILTADGLFEIE